MLQYNTLQPTGDIVEYDNTDIDYPLVTTIDTFGVINVAKLNGRDLNVLEVASSGKVAFTPQDTHSLDVDLEGQNIVVRARNSADLVIDNEDSTASLKIQDNGDITISSGATLMALNDYGTIINSGTGSNIFDTDVSHVFDVGSSQKLAIDTFGVTVKNLNVDGPEFRVPIGPTAERPTGTEGQVFYNSSANRFEGYVSGSWTGLGGTIDVDQNTFISAEDYPGANNDELKFVTNNVERMRIDSDGKMGFGITSPEFALDIDGDIRVSGRVITGATTLEETSTIKLGSDVNGTANVVDGLDTNNGAGMIIAGVPTPETLVSEHVARFEKSFTWNYGSSGMMKLGQKDAFDMESHWKLKGGALHLSNTNADTGDETAFIFRVNENDDLQLVKQVTPSDGRAVTYNVLAAFGTGDTNPVAKKIGFASLDMEDTIMQSGSVNAVIESLATYADTKVYAALYSTSDSPTTAEVVQDALSNGFMSGTLSAAVVHRTPHTFNTMNDGSSVPDSILKFAAVIEKISDGEKSASPQISFVLNDTSLVDADLAALENADTSTGVVFETTFDQLTWDSLTPTDQSIFYEWYEQQLIQGAEARGITVSSIDLTFTSGSVKVSTTMQILTRDVSKTLINLTSQTGSVSLLKNPTSEPIEFQDRASLTVSSSDVATTITQVQRLNTSPALDSVTKTAYTSDTVTLSYNVSEKNADFSVVKLYALSTTAALASAIPAKVKGDSQTQSFDVSAASGDIVVNYPANSKYIYVVAENNASPAVMSKVTRIVHDSMSIRAGSLVQGVSGYDVITKQDQMNVKLLNQKLKVSSDNNSITAYLMLFKTSASIPTTAQNAYNLITGGATAVSVLVN